MKKAALVTGGGKRIGRAIVLALAKAGYDIALNYNSSYKEAKETAKEVKRLGQKCILFQFNFTKVVNGANLIKKAKKKLPKLCLLINNASIFKNGEFLKTSVDLFEKHFNTNFKVPFFLSQDFAKFCKKGQIINMLDTNIVRKQSKYFAYTLSKKMLYEFTKMAAVELAPNIRVNAIAPGPILPPPGKNEEYLKLAGEKVPLKRKGEIKNILQALIFFLENDYITGQCIFVDGGKNLRG